MTKKERMYELISKGNKTSKEELELIQLSGVGIGKNYIGFDRIRKDLTKLAAIEILVDTYEIDHNKDELIGSIKAVLKYDK